MAFWSRKTGPTQSAAPGENPFRELDPEAFDKGEKINKKADELRRVAAMELTGTDVLVALSNALGHEIAATVNPRNPNQSADQKLYVMDEMLAGIREGVREAAYLAADLSPLIGDQGRDLSDDEFNALTMRIVGAATQNNAPVQDAVTATAKALAVQIGILAQRDGVSAGDLVKFSQDAIAEFADAATKFTSNRS